MVNVGSCGFCEVIPSCSEADKELLLTIEDPFERAAACLTRLDKSLENFSKHALTTNIHHYTNINSFKTIISTKKIRLSQYNGMRNDASEGEFILKAFHEACDELYNEKIITDEEKNKLCKIKLDFKHRVHKLNKFGEMIECIPYIMCFSYDSNNDRMWSEYTCLPEEKIDNGMSFTFNGYLMTMIDQKNPLKSYNYGTIQFARIIYGEDMIKKTFKKNITFMKELLEFDWILEITGHLLSTMRLTAKSRGENDKFYKENEVRLIVYIPINKSYNTEIMNGLEEKTIIDEKTKEKRQYLFINAEHIIQNCNVFLSPHCQETIKDIDDFMIQNNIKASIIDDYRNEKIIH